MSDSGGDGYFADADIRLFESGNFVDATIVCGDRTWKVHKVILSSRCKWFATAFYGKFAEAASGEIVLEEQDPDLIDAMIRFIYSKALCVRTFRLGDFFLLDEFKKTATAELKSHMNNMPTILDTETSNGECPKWLSEILDALDEAYKDRSTKPILGPLLDFMYMKNRKIFRSQHACALLDKIPEMARDLMRNYIIYDLVTQPPTRSFWGGLPVYAAVQFPNFVYEPSNEQLALSGWPTRVPCRLQQDVDQISRPFMPTDPETGTKLGMMRWMTPYHRRIKEMAGHPDSAIIKAKVEVIGNTKYEALFVRFDDPEDAKWFVDGYWRGNSEIEWVEKASATLTQEMAQEINRFVNSSS